MYSNSQAGAFVDILTHEIIKHKTQILYSPFLYSTRLDKRISNLKNLTLSFYIQLV